MGVKSSGGPIINNLVDDKTIFSCFWLLTIDIHSVDNSLRLCLQSLSTQQWEEKHFVQTVVIPFLLGSNLTITNAGYKR